MFAYCGNNPVNMVDPSGEFFFTALGAVTGFIGSAAVSLLQGNDLSKAVNDGVAGAVGGAIAGAGVDVGLLVVGTCGAATPIVAAAAGIAYVAGGAGNALTTYISSDGKASMDELTGSFIIGGTFNLLSFGTAYDFATPTMTRIAIKASFALTENILVGTATAVAAGTATHIGTTIARESNKGYANTERRMAK